MSWWGKLVGGAFGFMVGGPLGAVLGTAVGHTFDRGLTGIEGRTGSSEQERLQAAFFTATFSVMGHLAKADGRVNEREIDLAQAVMRQMNLTPDQRQAAQRLFREGKKPEFDLDGVLAQFRDECGRRISLMQMFIEIQLQAALADGHMAPRQEEILLHICSVVGFPEARFRFLEQMLRGEQQFHGAGGQSRQRSRQSHGSDGMSLADAYRILGVERTHSDDEVRRAYRRLMSQHHPDKLVARGLPDEMVEVAKEKSQDISRAWERIRTAREIR